MHKNLVIMIALAITVLCMGSIDSVDAGGKKGEKAEAVIKGCTDTGISGTATLRERKSEEGVKLVDIHLKVKGLSDGKHAVHIHETAQCEPCGAAKGHFDPIRFTQVT